MRDRLARDKPGRRRARDVALFAATLRAAGLVGNVPPPRRAPQTLAAQILRQPQFREAGLGPAPAPRESLLQRVLTWLTTQFAKLLATLFGAAAGTPLVGHLAAIVIILGASAAAGWGIGRLLTVLIRRTHAKQAEAQEGTPLVAPPDPQALYGAAMAAAAQGAYARAVGLLFVASLALLDRTGRIPYEASRTPGEYRRLVRARLAQAAEAFDTLAGVFVVAAFGERPVFVPEWIHASRAYEQLRSVVAP